MIYIALLRGINVGGNNIIKMQDLKVCFEKMGFALVKTYIQSGNVIFSTTEKNKNKLINFIEKELSDKFRYNSRIVLISSSHFNQIIEKAPYKYGEETQKFKFDVVFLKEPLNSKDAVKQVQVKEGVDFIFPGKSVLYISRLIAKASQSKFTKLISLPIYKNMTIRNWNTTTKLMALAYPS